MVLTARNIDKSFAVGWWSKRIFPVLKGVNLFIRHGETIGIVGGNGAGKTTLALILSGLLEPDKGEVWHGKERIVSCSSGISKVVPDRVQIVWQHPETAFNPRRKIRWSLSEPYRLHSIPATEDRLLHLLDRVELKPDVLERFPGQLSGGELQRLAVTRALALEPDVVILDEPTSMLDAVTQARIIRLLESIQRDTGVGYVFISHDRILVRLFCRRAYVLGNGVLKPLPTDKENCV